MYGPLAKWNSGGSGTRIGRGEQRGRGSGDDIPSTHDIPPGIPKWRRLSVDLDDFQQLSAALSRLQEALNICRLTLELSGQSQPLTDAANVQFGWQGNAHS
jgi:hypothetical protein